MMEVISILKRQWLSARLHGATYRKTVIFMLVVVRNGISPSTFVGRLLHATFVLEVLLVKKAEILFPLANPMMEEASTSETSFCHTTRCNIPEKSHLQYYVLLRYITMHVKFEWKHSRNIVMSQLCSSRPLCHTPSHIHHLV
jgi:hypothetical protein